MDPKTLWVQQNVWFQKPARGVILVLKNVRSKHFLVQNNLGGKKCWQRNYGSKKFLVEKSWEQKICQKHFGKKKFMV